MSDQHHPLPFPTVVPPLRWALGAVVLVVGLVVTAPAAMAHAEHQPLPPGFQARLTGVAGAGGEQLRSDAAPDAEFVIAPDGGRVTVAYAGPEELIVFGEQASEPLLRIAAGGAAVNAASPQARQVEGAGVDPADAAPLIDLVWDRVPARWVDLGEVSHVSFMDHRAVPGHAPDRRDFTTGEVAATWRIPFTVSGVAYTLTGEVVAVDVADGGIDPGVALAVVGAVAAMLAAAALLVLWRRVVSTPQAA